MGSTLTTAFIANNGTNSMLACSAPGQTGWSANTGMGQASKATPALTEFNTEFWTAFIANDPGNEVLVCFSPDGVHWSANITVGEASKAPPSLAVFNNTLWLAFQANDASNRVLVCSSPDGVHWSANTGIGQASQGAPNLAVFAGRLWLAFVANNSTNTVLICSSADGAHWSACTGIGQASKTAPSLAVSNNTLYLAFLANDSSNGVLICSSADGTHWSANTGIGQASNQGPALSALVLATGQVRPLYQVLTVIYAPPGTNGGKSTSSVDYASESSTGSKTSNSSSFKDGVDVTASIGVSATLGIGSVDLGASGDFTASNTQTDSSSLEIKKSASYEIKVTGPAEDGIDHDLDLFYLWLNPLLNVSMDPQGNLRWGIAVDGPTMLVQYVYAGWLKNPSTMPANVASVLSSRGLTTTDFAQILAMDPFAAASTAIDPARFQLTGQSLPYIPPYAAADPVPTTTYKQTASTTSTTTHQTQTQYSVGITASLGIKGPITGGLKIANSLQWTNTSSFEGSAESSESASVTIGGPAFGYTGPTDVLVYWDTIFGSFMFAFATVAPAASGNLTDASGNPVTGQPLTLTAGGQRLTTFTDSRGSYRFYGPVQGSGIVSAGGQQFSVATGPGAPGSTLRLAPA